MQPNQQEYSIDYLNQIAPQPNKPGMSNKLFIGVIIGGVLVALIVGLTLLNSGGPTNTDQLQALGARIATLEKVSKQAQRTLKSNELRSTNSTLSIFLTNASRDIEAPISNNGGKPKTPPKAIASAESGSKLIATLEDARLSGTYDRTYAREMSYQLATVRSLATTIYEKTNSKSTKAFLDDTAKKLAPISKEFDEFSASKL